LAFAFGAGSLADTVSIPGTPTAEVTERLASEFPEATGGTGSVVAATSDGSEFTADQQAAIGDLVAAAGDLDGVTAAIDPFATEAGRAARAEELAAGRAQAEEQLQQLTGQGADPAALGEVEAQ